MFEKEVISIPASGTIDLIYKYGVHAHPVKDKGYNYKSAKYYTFRIAGGIMEKVFSLEAVITLRVDEKLLGSYEGIDEEQLKRLRGYIKKRSENFGFNYPEYKFYLLQEVFELENRPTLPKRNNHAYFTLEELKRGSKESRGLNNKLEYSKIEPPLEDDKDILGIEEFQNRITMSSRESYLEDFKNKLVNWCENRQVSEKDIIFNSAHIVGKTHIKFTTPCLNSILLPQNDSTGEWRNGYYWFYEINNRPNKVFIYLVVGMKDLQDEQKEFINYLIDSQKKQTKPQKTYCLAKFNVCEYLEGNSIEETTQALHGCLTDVFEREIIPYQEQLKSLWSNFYREKRSQEIMEKIQAEGVGDIQQYKQELDSNIQKMHCLKDEVLETFIEQGVKPECTIVVSKAYKRNPAVVVATLRRADGYCEHCKQKAPFIRKSDQTPYLEVHHKIPLSEGGYDDLENTIALCPNCHRMFHFGM